MRRFVETTLLTALMAVLCIAGCQKIETGPAHYAENYQQATASCVEKAMASADITVAEIAAYLYSRGWTVVQAQMPKPHWKPATGQVSYYVCDIRVATGDTSLAMYFPQTAGPYCVQVKAVSAAGVSGPWSLVGWSDNGDGSTALPGVRP